MTEIAYRILIQEAAKDIHDNGESNSFLAFSAGVEWCRCNLPPETERLVSLLKKIIQQHDFQNTKLIYEIETAFDKVKKDES